MSAMQVVTMDDQVASSNMFDTVVFLFIQSIKGRLVLREEANKTRGG